MTMGDDKEEVRHQEGRVAKGENLACGWFYEAFPQNATFAYIKQRSDSLPKI
jgi:hypothetical protein